MYKNKITVKFDNGDFEIFTFDFDNTDFESLVYNLTNKKEHVYYFINWDDALFDKYDDYCLKINPISLKEEINPDLMILLDCCHEQIKGIDAILESNKCIYNDFIDRWMNQRENLEELEKEVFSVWCRNTIVKK